MKRVVSVADITRLARRRLPRVVSDFIAGGAEDESTVAANRAAFGRWSLVPRVLVDVSRRQLSTTVMGQRLSMPVGLAPVGLARLAHHRSVIESLVRRAQSAGYGALVLTVDVPIIGNRERDLCNGMTLPPRVTRSNAVDMLRRPRWLNGLTRGGALTFANFTEVHGRGHIVVALGKYVNVEMMNPGATWEAFEWVHRIWKGPLAIKGVLHTDDARRAVELGADAVCVSNHGGRQLDSAVAALDALPRVAEVVGDRAEVLLDGGMRRGTDVVKALSLGARAVLVGRPYVQGLGVGGEAGVARVLEIFRTELDRTLALRGVPDVGALDRHVVTRSSGDFPMP